MLPLLRVSRFFSIYFFSHVRCLCWLAQSGRGFPSFRLSVLAVSPEPEFFHTSSDVGGKLVAEAGGDT